MKAIIQKYIFLFNFEDEQDTIMNDVLEYIGQDNGKIVDYGIFGDGTKTNYMKSIWITEEYYNITYTAIHFSYYLDQDYPFNEHKDVDMKFVERWKNRHENDKKFVIVT